MSRVRKSSRSRKEETKSKASKPVVKVDEVPWYGVAAHYPIPTPDTPRKERGVYLNFRGPTKAKQFILALAPEGEIKWQKPTATTGIINLDGRVQIRMSRQCLDDVMEHDIPDDAPEMDFQTLDQVQYMLKLPRTMFGKNAAYTDDERPARKSREPQAERKPRVDRSGLVSIGDIAEELKVLPRDARAALRSLKIEKPDAGWAWPDDEAQKIKKRLKETLTK